MRGYSPDRWVIVTFNKGTDTEVSKILAGWYGGYLGGDVV